MQLPVLLPLPITTSQSQPPVKMCCWPFVDVQLADAPKNEEEQKEYVLVSDQLMLHPGVGHAFCFSSLIVMFPLDPTSKLPPHPLSPQLHSLFLCQNISSSNLLSIESSNNSLSIFISSRLLHTLSCENGVLLLHLCSSRAWTQSRSTSSDQSLACITHLSRIRPKPSCIVFNDQTHHFD